MITSGSVPSGVRHKVTLKGMPFVVQVAVAGGRVSRDRRKTVGYAAAK
jgi:hypothetical protein